MEFGAERHEQPISDTAGVVGSSELKSENGGGSTNLKQQRSGLASSRLPKMSRAAEVGFGPKNGSNENVAAYGRSNLWSFGVDDGQKMLSFSGNGGVGDDDVGTGITFSVFPDEHERRTGGALNEGIHCPSAARVKGPFTPSQWMELEHQALIYKHIVANVPVPSNLLSPIKKALYSYGVHASNILGWSPFHLGFLGSNNDPEPGRCRRTDGKKWRCSRDAVPDQKYCERHINRGRHRSRKPVEGHNGHAAISKSTSSKAAPFPSASSSPPFMPASSSSASNPLQPTVDHLHDHQSLINPSTRSEFGLVTSDSLINPAQRISYMKYDEKEADNHCSLHHFIDDWPKSQPDLASSSWNEKLKSDWTQLSMSISAAAADISSMDPHLDEQLQEKSHCLPVSWGSSRGGPLGEALASAATFTETGEIPCLLQGLNHNGQMGSSPTAVLHKFTFNTLSNSSSGSSTPSADNNINNNTTAT